MTSTTLDKFTKFIETKVTPPLTKLATQRHMIAIRDGFTAATALIIIGSMFLAVVCLPIPGWAEIIAPYSAALLMPFRMTMGIMSIWYSLGIGAALAKQYKIEPITAGVLAASVFFVLAAPYEAGAISTTYLGGTGVFTAVIAAIITVELIRFFHEKGIYVKMPAGVPATITASFETLSSGSAILLVAMLIRWIAGINVPKVIMDAFAPMIVAYDSLPAVILVYFIWGLVWTVGIHGGAVVGGIVNPFMMATLAENVEAAAAGLPLPHIFVYGFTDWIAIGGWASTLPLAIMCLRSKSKHLRSVGSVALIPGIFEINEPVTFGLPLVLNPIMMIPIIIIQPLLGAIAYIATWAGLVGRIYLTVPWTTPPIINMLIRSGFDVRNAILGVILFVVAMLVFYPFFKIYEKQLLEKEKA